MSTIKEEMKETADYAIKIANDRYKKDLDFSEQSITVLDNILTKISWGFSGPVVGDAKSGLAYNHALIWGSYLGEYMISKWGGKWIHRDSDRLVSINNILFFPIKYVYQKITDHPEFNVEEYINETRKIIYTSLINPEDTQFEFSKSERFIEQLAEKSTRKPIKINQRLVYMIAGILLALIIVAGGITSIRAMRSGGQPAFGSVQGTRTGTPTRIIPSPTPKATDTPTSSATPRPTVTPLPTETFTPTFTPTVTRTKTPTSTPTETQITLTPTNTYLPPLPPTATSVPPTKPPPPPTVPPVVIESCEVNPSTVSSYDNRQIVFIVHFSAPGYQFTADNGSGYGQSGCSGADDNGDGVAYCTGKSGELPDHTTVNVQITSPVGNCSTSYHSP
jgi:hypothetical protein